MKKGAIFDMDGTLLDSMGVWYNAGTLYLDKCGIKAEANLSEILFNLSMEESADYLKKNYLPALSHAQINAGVINVLAESYEKNIMPKNGAIDFLKKLKERGIKIAVATATDRRLFIPAFKRLEIADLPDAILTCGELFTSKAEPLIYFEAAKQLGLKASETIVFEDMLMPVQTAVKAGFFTVGVYDEYSKSDRQKIKTLTAAQVYDYDDFDISIFN